MMEFQDSFVRNFQMKIFITILARALNYECWPSLRQKTNGSFLIKQYNYNNLNAYITLTIVREYIEVDRLSNFMVEYVRIESEK